MGPEIGLDGAVGAYAVAGRREPRARPGRPAPIVRGFAPGRSAWAAYGSTPVPGDRSSAVLRSGYGDGFPKKMVGGVDIPWVGMRYAARVMHDGADPRTSIGTDDDVDRPAAR